MATAPKTKVPIKMGIPHAWAMDTETYKRGTKVSKHGAYRPQKLYSLLGTGRRGEGVWRWGEGDYIPIATPSPPE